MTARGPRRFSRYELHAKIAAGGMATVHFGRVLGAAGFSRTVAIKRLHPHMAQEPEFVAMFLDEANVAARVRHPNVVSTLDVAQEADELFLVLEYVDGESLAGLMAVLRERGERAPLPVVSGIVAGLLRGLHAAHEACGPDGKPLHIVHRDVSPQNVLVGADGVARVVDFGIALANVRLQTTRQGQVKGKLAYTAPELLSTRAPATVASDVYAAGLVLWEICAGRRAFHADTEEQLLVRVLSARLPRLDETAPWLPLELVDTIERAIARKPEARYPSALEMALALEQAVPPASADTIGAFVEHTAEVALARRRAMQREVEATESLEAAVAPSRPVPKQDEEATPAAPRSPHREKVIAVSVGILVLASAAVVARPLFRTAPPATEAKATTDERPVTPTASTDLPPPPSEATSSASPPKEPDASAARPASRPPTRATVRSDKLESPQAKGCDPPYTFDDQGIRRVKRECFGR